MIDPLNPWLATVLKKAQRLYEDSDRKTFAARLFDETLKRAHKLATSAAIRCPEPKLERLQLDDGAVVLTFEWADRDACWHLYFSVTRKLSEKPYVVLDFSGTSGYSADNPNSADIQKALHDYFEKWKREPGPQRLLRNGPASRLRRPSF